MEREFNESEGNLMFDGFLFEDKTKTLKKIDPENEDSFSDAFNEVYGGNLDLNVKDGNLYLKDDLLIETMQSQIKKVVLNDLKKAGGLFLRGSSSIEVFEARSLEEIGSGSFQLVPSLKYFITPSLKRLNSYFLSHAPSLKYFYAPKVTFADIGVRENAMTRIQKIKALALLLRAKALPPVKRKPYLSREPRP